MEKIYISLGSNLENRHNNLLEACRIIETRLGKIEAKSMIYETEPWGFETTDQFLNQVICLSSDRPAQTIMEILLAIEKDMGRIRHKERYSSRIIDIDILFMGQKIIKNEIVEIPHPRVHERNFVLIPMKDIARDFVHPNIKKTISELLDDCKDELVVKIFAK